MAFFYHAIHQSTFPFGCEDKPSKPSFFSERRTEEFCVLKCRRTISSPTTSPTNRMVVTKGWSMIDLRIRKKKCEILDPVALGTSFGGDTTTLGRVSSMDVRDGTMGLPVIVLSQ